MKKTKNKEMEIKISRERNSQNGIKGSSLTLCLLFLSLHLSFVIRIDTQM